MSDHEHAWYVGTLDANDPETTICQFCGAIACSCGAFVADSSGDAGCGNCGADYPPLDNLELRMTTQEERDRAVIARIGGNDIRRAAMDATKNHGISTAIVFGWTVERFVPGLSKRIVRRAVAESESERRAAFGDR